MFCKRCARETVGNALFCDDCERIVYGVSASTETDAMPNSPETERSVKVNAGIYKLLCICMGLCLVAGSVVWAALFMRDRMDSPIKKTSSAPVTDAFAEQAPEAEFSETAATTTKVTTTTTVTTTTDPFKQTVTPQFLDSYGTMFSLSDAMPIRIGPGYDYERLSAEIPSGTALPVSAEQLDTRSGETWCYISYADSEGWVAKSMLSQTNPTIATIRPDEYYYGSDRKTVTVKRMGGLYLYSGPDSSYEVILKLEEGDTAVKEGYNYFSVKWSYVSVGDQYGWIQTYDGDWFNPTIE